jgi:hypothetical protein
MIVNMQGELVKPKPNWIIKFEFEAEEYDKESIKNIAEQISIMLNNSNLKHQGTYGTTEDESRGGL